MTTETDVVNLALTLLGESRIDSLTDGSKPAQDASAIFVPVRDELMSRYNWTFAMKRGQAALNAEAPAFGFANAFDFPSDCLRVVRPGARYQGPDLTDYRNGPSEEYTVEGRQILTDWDADGTNATGDADKVVSIDIVTAGTVDSAAPTFTIGAPPPGGVQATGKCYIGLAGVRPNGAIPGSGYQGTFFNEALTLEGGTPRAGNKGTMCIFQGIGVGAPVHYEVLNEGEYTTTPGILAISEGFGYKQGCATSGGAGAGSAQVDTWWKVISTEILNPGSGYLAPPLVIVNPGSGINFSFSTTLGDLASSYLNVLYIARKETPDDWDAYFIKLLAAQLALDLCEPLTQSSAKRAAAEAYFMKVFRAAVMNNAIQLPPKKLGDDEWIFSRL
jgi:hypothetical protein